MKTFIESHLFKLNEKDYVIDPSFLSILFEQEIDSRHLSFCKNIYIPDKLHELILKTENSEKKVEKEHYRKFLLKFLNYFTYNAISHRHYDEYFYERFFENYKYFAENLKIIKEDDVDKKSYQFCMETFKNNSFYISMSPKMNFLGHVLGQIIGFSNKNKTIIIMKTRKFANLFREKIMVIELPEKIQSISSHFDELLNEKKKITEQFFIPFGGNKTKYFISLVLYAHNSNVASLFMILADP